MSTTRKAAPGGRTRTTITIPEELLGRAGAAVAAGRAVSTSALIQLALERELDDGDLQGLVADLERIHGSVPGEIQDWADEVMTFPPSS